MENITIVKKFFEARKNNNEMTIKLLAMENIDLIKLLISNEKTLCYQVSTVGTMINHKCKTSLSVMIGSKKLDGRNPIVKQLNKYLDCWNSNTKQFILEMI